MADINLLPGFGDVYTSVAVGSTDTYPQSKGTDDTLDCSHLDAFAIQVLSTTASPTGTIQVEQTFNNSTYANLGSSINVATDAATLFEESDGPFGKIKINV